LGVFVIANSPEWLMAVYSKTAIYQIFYTLEGNSVIFRGRFGFLSWQPSATTGFTTAG